MYEDLLLNLILGTGSFTLIFIHGRDQWATLCLRCASLLILTKVALDGFLAIHYVLRGINLFLYRVRPALEAVPLVMLLALLVTGQIPYKRQKLN